MATSSPSSDDTATLTATYRIIPSDEQLDADALRDAFERLHGIGTDAQFGFGLVTRGDSIEYYVFVDADQQRIVEHTLRGLFPDSTRIEATDLPDVFDTDQPPTAAPELHGWAERREDWQTRLRPVAGADESPQFPLAAIVDMLAAADSTVAYQLHPDG